MHIYIIFKIMKKYVEFNSKVTRNWHLGLSDARTIKTIPNIMPNILDSAWGSCRVATAGPKTG